MCVWLQAWLRDGSSFITGDEKGTIQYFEWTITRIDTRPICPSPGLSVCALSVAPTCSNHRFVSSGDDKKLRVWDWDQHREEVSLEGHGHRVNSVAWHPTWALIASASRDHTVRGGTRAVAAQDELALVACFGCLLWLSALDDCMD